MNNVKVATEDKQQHFNGEEKVNIMKVHTVVSFMVFTVVFVSHFYQATQIKHRQ